MSRSRSRLPASLVFSFFALSAVIACGEDAVSAGGPSAPSSAADAAPGPTQDAAADAATTPERVVQPVGAEGGTVKTESGSGVEIPAGALGEAVDVSVEEDPTAPEPQVAGDAVGTPVTFGPEGQQFAVPVTVTLVVDAARLPAGKTLADVVVMTAPRDSTAFTALPTRVRDGSLVAADTMHFSTFVPFVPADVPDGGAPDVDAPDADLPDADLPDADAPDADLPDADVPDGGSDGPYIGNIGPMDPRWPGLSPAPSGPGETVRVDMFNTHSYKVGPRVFFVDPEQSTHITVYVAPIDGPGPRELFLQVSSQGRPPWMRLSPFVGDAQGNVYWIETDDEADPSTSVLKRKRADDPASAEEILPATNPLYYGFNIVDEVVYYLDRHTSELRGLNLTTGTETTFGQGHPCNVGGDMVVVDLGKIYWRGETDVMVHDVTTHSTGIAWDRFDCGWKVRAGTFYASRYIEASMLPARHELVTRDLADPEAPTRVLFTSNAAIGQQLDGFKIEGNAAYGVARWNTEASNRLARVSLVDGAFQPLAYLPANMSLMWTTPSELWLAEGYGYVPNTNPRFMSSRLARLPLP